MGWRRAGLIFRGGNTCLLPLRLRVLFLRVKKSLLLKSLLPPRPPSLLLLLLLPGVPGSPTTVTILPSKHQKEQTRCRRRWRLWPIGRSEHGRRNGSKGRCGAEYQGMGSQEANMRVSAEEHHITSGRGDLLYSYPICWVRRFIFWVWLKHWLRLGLGWREAEQHSH